LIGSGELVSGTLGTVFGGAEEYMEVGCNTFDSRLIAGINGSGGINGCGGFLNPASASFLVGSLKFERS
jgi:hypothetical protein